MTHFIGAVAVPPEATGFKTQPTKYPTLYGEGALEVVPGPELEAYLAEALAPFDENMEYEAWIPKAEIIAKGREGIEEYRTGLYEKAVAEGRESYAARVENKRHVEYVFEEFPAKLEWTDEQVYADAIQHEEPEDIRESDGAVRTHYNPASKWDWWTIGGRWEDSYREQQGQPIGILKEKIADVLAALDDPEEVEKARLAKEKYDAADKATWSNVHPAREQAQAARDAAWEELKACRAFIPWSFPYSIVHPVQQEDGQIVSTWTTKGRMGWFGMSDDKYDDADWLRELAAVLDTLPDEAALFYVDFHI